MTIKKNIWADIQDGVTQGLAAAVLVNDNKRAVNEVIDVVNGLGTASTMTNASGGSTLGTASTRNVATTAQAIAGTAGVLPDAAGVAAFVHQYGVGIAANHYTYTSGSLDNLTVSGLHSVAGSSVTGKPTGSITGAGASVLVIRTGVGGRLFQCYAETAGGSNRSWTRVFDGLDWSSWAELYHTGNTVGTVSQSGGVPTGAIIQWGSNANGEFVRYADGTQICTLSVSLGSRTAFGSGTYNDPFRTNTFHWSLPANFITAPSCSGTTVIDSTTAAVRNQTVGCSTISASTIISIQSTSVSSRSSDDEVIVCLTAIGRWY